MGMQRKVPSLTAAVKRIKSSKVTSVDEADDFKNQLSLANEALQNANLRIKELEIENSSLQDNSKIKNRAVDWAFMCLWLVPAICGTIFTLSVIPRDLCFWGHCPEVKISDTTQLALVTGPMVLLATVLGLVLRGVFPAKSTMDGDSNVVQTILKELMRSKN
jgi:hypothetical protein